MKHIYLLLTVLISTFTFAQVPANYYSSATGTEYTLKTQLKDIINNVNDGLSPEYISTDPGYGALYNTYLTSDVDLYYENNGSMLDMYTENPTGADIHEFFYNSNPSQQDMGTGGTAEGQFYNREHIIPQSTFGSASPMRSDAHFVVPTDKYINGQRGSFPFGVVATPSPMPYSNGSKRGSSAVVGYSGTVFEPIDEFKGDIARMHFYFATRYESTVAGYNYDMFNNTSDQVFTDAFLDLLLTWHNNDPVSQREIDRNNAIFAIQNNRNPFIDHPEYVNAIWNPTADTQAPTTPTNLVASNPTATTVDLAWTASTDNVGVVSYDIYIGGALYTNTGSNNTTYTVTGLNPETTYSFTILAKDAAGNMSALSTSASETTLAGSSGGGDLFFSEYIEGSSNNKALEIANFTGTDITDLSIYELRISSNGNASWTGTYNFPGGASITNNDVYVIGNGSLAVCTGAVDDSNNTITGFNGNDAIGLFKNGTLIDILGTLGDNSTYAQNTTLVRKSTVAGGNTVFDLNEWDSFASNTCDDLGQHTQSTLSTVDVSINKFKIYPNPIKGNLLTIENIENTRFEIYNILGKKILTGTITPNNNKISVSSLNQGVYILKLNNSNGTITKKLIKE
ncbi:endonuclease [Olleya sp. YS]|uniref:endonuclease n=1 Tax=Olleya sp. YS TaxID=3028318 RepID=UPI0024343617|nr:endonuclease [Olleya sp. YS]WGD34979.1 endonuclease [Olleya sp. YS]